MSGVIDRMVAAVNAAIQTTGKVPAYLHVASDVYEQSGIAPHASFEITVPRTGPVGYDEHAVPVRESKRLPPGYIVPVMPLPSRAETLAEGISAATGADVARRLMNPPATYDASAPCGLRFTNAHQRDLILVDEGERYAGWLCYRQPDGQWVPLRKATRADRAALDARARLTPDTVRRSHQEEWPSAWPEGDIAAECRAAEYARKQRLALINPR